MKYFNIAGPCTPAKHYMIDAATRLKGVEQLIDMEHYFVIHAARQSGKTTYLRDLTTRLNAKGQCYALYCSLENMQRVVDPEKGIPEIVWKIQNTLASSAIPHNAEFAKDANFNNFTGVLEVSLSRFCRLLDKPLVILFDEADCLSEDTLIAFLRQLRSGYNDRSFIPFVSSVALVGMRNIRDYKAKIRPNSASMGSASPFNIVTKTMTLKNFTQDEIAQLYQQHTEATGQQFEPDAVALVHEQTQGQPWLVNAIANEVIAEKLQRDYTVTITAAMVSEAIQAIILNRPAHIDSLLERLNEERVRKIIEPMILGDGDLDTESDDYSYAIDLGLIRELNGVIMPANPIYAEVIIRKLTSPVQKALLQPAYPYQMSRYLKDGRIDMDYLMRDFQQFWRENSAIWKKKFDYEEAAPHLVLMAFLQRVVNGGGQIIREMGVGNGRIDLCLLYEGWKYPIELKILRGKNTLQKGLTQTARYMDTYGCSEGWLAIFDRRTKVKWDDKIYTRKEAVDGKTITVVGC
jgi:type II secretory pathway predicted ATPase ExeA